MGALKSGHFHSLAIPLIIAKIDLWIMSKRTGTLPRLTRAWLN
jgi:hypothetical protein